MWATQHTWEGMLDSSELADEGSNQNMQVKLRPIHSCLAGLAAMHTARPARGLLLSRQLPFLSCSKQLTHFRVPPPSPFLHRMCVLCCRRGVTVRTYSVRRCTSGRVIVNIKSLRDEYEGFQIRQNIALLARLIRSTRDLFSRTEKERVSSHSRS